MSKYDSTAETLKHILRIQELLHQCAKNILDRADKHDRSKLSEKEKSIFDVFTPKLKNSTYGSDEYKSYLDEMKPALDNHYKENMNHHPDALENGINDMDLLDMIEMIVDWKCASERHDNGNILKSIEINQKRFKMSEQLVYLFQNTVFRMGWGKAHRFVLETSLNNGYPLPKEFIKWFIEKYPKTKIQNNFEPFEPTQKWRDELLFQGCHHLQYYIITPFDITRIIADDLKIFGISLVNDFKEEGFNKFYLYKS